MCNIDSYKTPLPLKTNRTITTTRITLNLKNYTYNIVHRLQHCYYPVYFTHILVLTYTVLNNNLCDIDAYSKHQTHTQNPRF